MSNLAEKVVDEAIRDEFGHLNPHLTGLFAGIPMDEYRAFDAMSSSGFSHLKQSPAHYWTYLNEVQKDTPAKQFGRLAHSAILEPQIFERYIVMPDKNFDRRTKEGKQNWIDFHADNCDKVIVPLGDYEVISGMLEACYKHSVVSKLLKGGVNEVSGFWNDHLTEMKCKLRMDKFLPQSNTIIDLKTTDNATEGKFKGSMGEYMYHVQSAFYLEGVGTIVGKVLSDFVHIAIEKEKPYGINVFTLDDVSLAAGSDFIRKHMEIYEQCKKANVWPGYSEEVKNIQIPAYLLNVSSK